MDLPPGPGYGNGTGGANGARGTIGSAGFGNGTAIPPTSSGRRTTVQQSGFSDAAKITEAPKKAAAQSTAAVQPVEILAKPRPAYTEEARHLKLEGEVLLEAVFGANGQVQIIRVIRGLGHGLDESAIRAAQQIRYKPAAREGQPVDFPATVHIVFQLAY
jgi:TonB family protein